MGHNRESSARSDVAYMHDPLQHSQAFLDAPVGSAEHEYHRNLDIINHNWDSYNLEKLIDYDLLPKTPDPASIFKVSDVEHWDGRLLQWLVAVSCACKDFEKVNRMLRSAMRKRVAKDDLEEGVQWMTWHDAAMAHYTLRKQRFPNGTRE